MNECCVQLSRLEKSTLRIRLNVPVAMRVSNFHHTEPRVTLFVLSLPFI